MKSNKMGRPKLPKAQRKAIRIQARFSQDEYKTVESAVKRSGGSESDWVRKALLSVAESEIAA